jgi:hypothetical protein
MSSPNTIIDFGEWIGHYPGHFDEVVRITREGDEIKATKITGDDFVPAGEVPWRVDLLAKKAWGRIAEIGYINPRDIPSSVVFLSEDRLVVRWENCGEVEFRYDF